jgi:hypothetical protein
MIAFEDRNSPSHTQPFEGFETPFLNKELLTKQAKDEWQGRFSLLEFQTPFLGEFEQMGTHPDAAELESPEAFVNEFEQEYESSIAQWSLEPVSEEEQTLTGGDYQERPAQLLLEQPLSESFLPIELPKQFLAVAEALSKKDWSLALKLAIQAGQHDEQNLTNLIFFARHSELPTEPLDRNHPHYKQLSSEWIKILKNEIRPAIASASENVDLKVSGVYVAERDPQFVAETGKKFKELVAWAASEVNLNPGFLAAVLLAEWDQNSLYLSSGAVSSFRTGTDDFFAQAASLRANVPAFSKVGFDEKKKTTSINEHGRVVTTIPFNSGKDAALATAVYLKYAEIKLRNAAQKNGGDFDKLPIETQYVLVRIAMAAGHGGLSPDGDLIRFKWQTDRWVPVKKGEKGGALLGVASSLERVLKGEDILIRKNEPRKDPTNSGHVTLRNATILAAQAMHLSDWIFGIPTANTTQPELETFDDTQQEFKGSSDFEDQFDWDEAGGSRETFMKSENPPVNFQKDSAEEVDLYGHNKEVYGESEYEDLLLADSEAALAEEGYAIPIRDEEQAILQRPLEERPANPVSDTYVPPGGTRIQVATGQSWVSIAQSQGIDPWDLIDFNFPSMKQLHQSDPQRASRQVNWYLSQYIGCEIPTADKMNWSFTSNLTKGKGLWKGGHIFLPPAKSPVSTPTATCATIQIPPLINAFPLQFQLLLKMLDISLPSQARCLNQAERALAAPVYGGSLDYDAIYVSDGIGLSQRPFTTAIPTSTNWIVILNLGANAFQSGAAKDDLIHELAHAWQSQHHPIPWQYMYNCIQSQVAAAAASALVDLNSSWLMRLTNPMIPDLKLGPASAYAYIPGKPFGEYGGEQIAQQVEDYYSAVPMSSAVKSQIKPIVDHIRSLTPKVSDPHNIQSLSKTRYAHKSFLNVVWP